MSRGAGVGVLPGPRTAPGSRRGDDRGAGTIWVLGLIGVIWLVAVAVMVAGGVRALRHRAHTAADQAALAAASRAPSGSAAACRVARAVAVESGGRLLTCVLHEGIADVSVSVRSKEAPWRTVGLGAVEIVARARAGPALPLGNISG